MHFSWVCMYIQYRDRCYSIDYNFMWTYIRTGCICVLARARWTPLTTHAKQWPGKAENERTRDWGRSTARNESGARSQWLRELIPDQNMFAQNGTRNLKHGRCGGSEFRCGLMAASDRKKTSNWSTD